MFSPGDNVEPDVAVPEARGGKQAAHRGHRVGGTRPPGWWANSLLSGDSLSLSKLRLDAARLRGTDTTLVPAERT